MIDNVLIEFMREQLAITSTDFVRHKYSEIDWSLQMFGLVGPRGVGKTTLAMFLQMLSETTEGLKKVTAIGIDGFHHYETYLNTHTTVRFCPAYVGGGGIVLD